VGESETIDKIWVPGTQGTGGLVMPVGKGNNSGLSEISGSHGYDGCDKTGFF
jgi:hypothetical protein